MNYTFTFTEPEANIMLQALTTRPYAEVASLIANIQKQVQMQHTPNEASNENNPPQN